MFLWRGARNALSTKMNLWKRRCSPSTDCPFCPGLQETTDHLLRSCPKAAEIWALFPRSAPNMMEDCSDLIRWFRTGVDCLSSQDAANRFFCGWHIWKRRNNFIFQEDLTHPSTTAFTIKNAGMNFKKRTGLLKAPATTPSQEIGVQ
ncbi:hypothetical protein LINPERHAP2_LOCUS34666 [Linum perenne]